MLRSPIPGSTAYGKLFVRSDMPYLVAMAARLAPPPAGQAYHLWLTFQGQTTLAGTMNVNQEGFGLLIYRSAEINPAYDRADLTLEPLSAGSPPRAPSDEPVLIWPPPE